MFFVEHILGRTLQVAVLIRVVKQAELILCLQDAAAGAVDVLHAEFAFVERLLQRAYKTVTHHIHIHTCLEGTRRDGLQVTDAVGHHFGNAGVVSHHETVKPPLRAQHVGHQPFVGRGRYAVHFVERCHEAAGSGLCGCLIGIKVFIEHAVTAHVHRVVVTAGIGCAVKGKVLHASHYLVIALQLGTLVSSLVATHHGLGNGASQEWVFTVAFAGTSPTRVAANVHHRAEGPANAVGTGLGGRNARRLLHGFHVPAAGQAQGDGEHRLIAVNHIHAEQQGDAQTGIFHGKFLYVADAVHAFQVEQAAYKALLNQFGHIAALGLPGDNLARHRQVQLTDFFFHGHLAHQFRNERVHVAGGTSRLLAFRCRRRHHCGQGYGC